MNKYSQYSLTNKQIQDYLHNIIAKWPKIDTSTGNKPTSTPTGLYVTYIPLDIPVNLGDRVDIYDNSLLANALIIVNDTNIPDPIVIFILDFLANAIIWLQSPENKTPNSSKLIVAAYQFITPYISGLIADPTQDVGNNSLIGIVLAKFCLTYPQHPKTSIYIKCVDYLITIFVTVMLCDDPKGKGILGHFPKSLIPNENYVSTEHMIDCYALAILGEKLNLKYATQLKTISQSFVTDPSHYDTDRYYIGTSSGCTIVNKNEWPVDVNTWNMLSGVDNIQSKKFDSLKWVYDNTLVKSPDNPGIQFAASKLYGYTGSIASQYENTGSFLCSLAQYFYTFNDDIFSKLDTTNTIFKLIFNFLYTKIIANEIIQAAYNVNDQSYKSPPGGCFANQGTCSFIGGNPWIYKKVFHLGATVYCSLALLNLNTKNSNIYQLTGGPPQPQPQPPPAGGINKNTKLIIIIISSFFGLVILLGIIFWIKYYFKK
jgi:hypothetical protein